MKENINHVDMIEMKTSAGKLPSYKLLTFFICSLIWDKVPAMVEIAIF